MQDPEADKALRKHFNSRARRVKAHHGSYLVPLRYDPKTSEVLTEEKFDARKHYKKLSQDDWAFLECWKRNDYDSAKTRDELALTDFNLERLVKKLDCFRREELQDKALATIPSTTYLKARHTENVLGGTPLDESQRDSLKELAKILGAYKPTTTMNLHVDAFVKPPLSPEQEKATREFFDTIATETA